ncbi:MAG: HYR domain-containing protein [Chloroflexota bacterium]
MDVFASGGGLDYPIDMIFGSDGNLYVSGYYSDAVHRYNGTTGAFMDVFASGGGMDGPIGVAFGMDGNLYVSSRNPEAILRYNGSTGSFIGVFASGGGLSGSYDLAFGPDGNLYVASLGTDNVLRFNGTTGAFVDVFASGGGLDQPTFLLFTTPATPPGAFGKSAPSNGATGVSTSPTLSWGASSGQTDYEYCIDPNINGACDSGGAWTSTSNTASVGLSGLAPGNGYEWQARAVNGSGNTEADSGTWWTFTTQPDTTPPIIAVPSDMVAEATGPSGAAVNYVVTATDDVDPSPAVVCNPPSGSTFPLGATTVNCSATDDSGNTSNGSFDITVQDTTPPLLDLPTDMTVEAASAAGVVVNFSATAADAVDPTPTVNCVPASGSIFPLGTTTVNCSAADDAGNVSNGSFDVTVQDTTAPSLNLPTDMTVEATDASGAVVNFSATAADAVDPTPTVICNPPSGSIFPLGTTTVNCSATDDVGNTSNGSFDVTVQDTTAPSLNVPADMTVEATSPAGAVVNFSVTAADAVDPTPTVNCVPASGSTFPLGATTVNCSATDDAGNVSNDSFDITVQDTTPPVLTLPPNMLVDATSAAGAFVNFTATATDVVDASPTVICAPPSGSLFPFGVTTVNCTATDDSGNSDNGSFTVTVQHSTTEVVLYSPANAEHLNYNRNVAFDWSDFPRAVAYQIQVSRNPTFTSLLFAKKVFTSYYVYPYALPANAALYWRVRATINGLVYGPWSETFMFTTANPPSTPTLVSPANGAWAAGPSPLFDWTDSRLPTGTTLDHYQIQIAADSGFTNIVHDKDTVVSQDNSAALAAGAIYYWRVRAFNAAGDYSSWSVVWFVRISGVSSSLPLPASAFQIAHPFFEWTEVTTAPSNFARPPKLPGLDLRTRR